MADKPLKTPLPADLPQNWALDQIVSPNGAEAGLDEKHGYNYQSKQINDAQSAVNTLNEGMGGKVDLDTETGKVKADQMPPYQAPLKDAAAKTTLADADSVSIVDSADGSKTKRITWTAVKAVLKTWLDTLYAAASHTHAWAAITGKPSVFAPDKHAASHRTGGADALTAEDLGAVPATRKVNNKALSADITLTAPDVGARPSTWTPTATDVGAIPAGQKGAAGGVATLDGSGMVPVSQLPSQVKERRVVNTIAERNAIADKFSGLQVYVKDATADPTVSTGGADYLWDGAVWIKTGESESMDVVLKWANITEKPATFPPSTHSHTKSQITDFPTTMTPAAHTHVPTDLTAPVPVTKGGTGATTAAAARTALDACTLIGPTNVTIGTSWTGSGPWTQTVSVAGVTAADEHLEIELAWNADAATRKAQGAALGCIERCETVAGGLKFTTFADKKPDVAIQIVLKGAR